MALVAVLAFPFAGATMNLTVALSEASKMPNPASYAHDNLARQILQRKGTDDALTPDQLARHAARLIDTRDDLRELARRSGDALGLRHGLARLPLSPKLAELLGVARAERPQLFEHLLQVALISHYLALRRGLSDSETTNVLLAALTHDLGELHIDPAMLDPQHRLDASERRHIYVHPITGSLIVRELEVGDAAIATAVLQHQERIDGSGYPFALRGAQVGLPARIVGLADVCASMLSRRGGRERLNALMRLNRQKFDPHLLALLDGAFGQAAPAPRPDIGLALPRMTGAARLMARWAKFSAGLAADAKVPPEMEFLLERMTNLRTMLAQFGFDPERQQMLETLAAEDPNVGAELAAALDEVYWQFADLEREIVRRRAIREAGEDNTYDEFLAGWNVELHAYLDDGGRPTATGG